MALTEPIINDLLHAALERGIGRRLPIFAMAARAMPSRRKQFMGARQGYLYRSKRRHDPLAGAVLV